MTTPSEPYPALTLLIELGILGFALYCVVAVLSDLADWLWDWWRFYRRWPS